MNDRQKPNALQLFLYGLLAVMIIAAIVLGVKAGEINAQVQWAKSLTPTPLPPYGSVMQVTPDPSAPTPPPVIRSGASGETVWKLQERLQALGYYTGTLDGQFGPATKTAVILFQQENGLEADGIVGTDTSTLLYSEAARRFEATPTPEPTAQSVLSGQSGDSVVNIQTRLKALGYYTGSVDGQFGPATRAAVVLFQSQHGLEADGIVGSATTSMLFSAQAHTIFATATPAPAPEGIPGTLASGMPMLVNRDNYLPDNYRTHELVMMRDYCDSSIVKIKGSEIQGERIAVDALMTMLRAAHADGVTVWQISAGYRSIEYQQKLFDNQVYAYRQEGYSGTQARAKTRETVADPGASEHHTGLAFDVTVPGEQFSNTKQHIWLAQHCWEYGFIIRYPIDKVDITGISYEPWHIRYVGTEHSLKMQNENLCLEEYIEKYGN